MKQPSLEWINRIISRTVTKVIIIQLHVDEITRGALEGGLIETLGATPERTMSTEIRRDVKSKKNNSPFRLVGNAI